MPPAVAVADLLTSAAQQAPGFLSSLANNPHVVGATWVISSSIFTTYSTTKFLKYTDNTSTTLPTYHRPLAKNKKSTSLASSVSTAVENVTSNLPRPVLLTLFRFGGSLLLGLLLSNPFSLPTRLQSTLRILPHFALPAAFLFLANYSNSISLERIGISLTYTSKCAIPLMTVFLTMLLDGVHSLPSLPTLMTLLPIATGIAMASWNSPTFEALGFTAAMISCTAQSALNVSSKRAMMRTGVAGPEAQRAMVAVGLLITLLLSYHELSSKRREEALHPLSTSTVPTPPVWLSALAVAAYHVEYVLSFMFVKLVAPITYGASDAVRRLAIILSGRRMFGGEPFSLLNMMGIGLALVGALGYSILSSAAKIA